MDIPPDEPFQTVSLILQVLSPEVTGNDWIGSAGLILVILILLMASALFSSSETAFFSLGPQEIKEVREQEDKVSTHIIKLLYSHKKLLATILIANNFVNVSIVFLSTFLFSNGIFESEEYQILGFIIQTLLVTGIIVFLGEVFPKVYATANKLKIARLMALPLWNLSKVLAPFIFLLEKSTSLIDKRMSKKGHSVSIDELNQAIDMTSGTSDQSEDEKDILKGIVNYGSIPVKQIMRSRMDVNALEISMSFPEVLDKIREWGYSRLPVYEENLDTIKGVLYIKDLVQHIRNKDYPWQQAVRPPYFVPESKKLDDLMNDFQEKRVHMAIVVDEYGGSSGLVTMEDVLEEIFGEIKDEFDDDDIVYSRIDERTYVFEAKTLINDVCRLMDLEHDHFDDIRGDSDTLGGMLIEIQGKIPGIGSRIKHNDTEFVVESADKRRIKRVKVILPLMNEKTEKQG